MQETSTFTPSSHLHSLLPIRLLALILLRAPELLVPVLPLLPLLPARLLDLVRMPDPYQPVVWLELLHRLHAVVDQSKPRRFSTAEVCSHAEDVDLVLVRFVEFGEFGAEVVFGWVGFGGVEDVAGGGIC